MKTSQKIKQECCGNCYNSVEGKKEVVQEVEDLEHEIHLLKIELIKVKNSRFAYVVCFWLVALCFFSWLI